MFDMNLLGHKCVMFQNSSIYRFIDLQASYSNNTNDANDDICNDNDNKIIIRMFLPCPGNTYKYRKMFVLFSMVSSLLCNNNDFKLIAFCTV